MINTNKRVCAVIVTYNRKEYLVKLLTGLFNQSYKLDGILIIDNNSTDGTETELSKFGFINENVEYNILYENLVNGSKCYYMKKDENDGGAGGFHKAFEISMGLDYEFIWVMDDDVYPEERCLEHLLDNINEDTKVCVPNRSDDKYKDVAITGYDLSNPFKYYTKRKIKYNEFNNKKVISITDMPFEGPLFSIDIIKKVGLPKKEFFIFCDDTEYALRAKKHTNISFVTYATLHKMIIPKKEKIMNWRAYYAYRNAIVIDRLYGENIFVRYLSPIFLWIEYILKAILQLKTKNVKIITKAFLDGYLLRLGKRVKPGEF